MVSSRVGRRQTSKVAVGAGVDNVGPQPVFVNGRCGVGDVEADTIGREGRVQVTVAKQYEALR